jgi:hypothetical protein
MLVGGRVYEGLKCLNKRNIQIIPLNKVDDNNKTKYAYRNSLGSGWTIRPSPFKEVIKSIKRGIVGFAIKTGVESNIVVIDYDMKDNKNPKILEELKKLNTFCIKTPSGGLHFYFKYTNVFTKGHTGIFGCYDIRTKGNCCFFGKRTDGDYQIIDENAEILECPKHITKELYEEANRYTLTKTDIDNNKTTPTPTKLINKTTKLNDENKHKYIKNMYFITDNSLLYILNKLPSGFYDIYDEWILISAILKKYGYEKLWDIWSKQSKSYNKEQNKYLYSKIDITKVVADLNYIVYLVNSYKDEKEPKTSNIEVVYKPYEELKCKELNPIKINEKYIPEHFYNNLQNNIVLLIQSGLGTGKTYTTFKYAIENNFKILSIVHLISLCDNQTSTYNKLLNQYLEKKYEKYVEQNRDIQTELFNFTEYCEEYSNRKKMSSYQSGIFRGSICTTLNSLIKVNQNIMIEDYYIYIDEVHRVISYLLHSKTFKNRKEVFTTFSSILRRCKGVIGTDGDIDNITYDFFQNILNMEITYVENNYKSFKNIPVSFYNNHKSLIHIMKKCIINKEEFTVACNTKKDADNIQALLIKSGVNSTNTRL